MRILALDCCGASCGAGLWQDGKLLAFSMERMGRGQDARLMPMVCAVMAEARCGFDELDRIAVARGPGSFTGMRVGLAAARGMGLASCKPVIGIDRFSIYRRMHPGKNVLVVIDSRRAELFCKFFPAEGQSGEAVMMTRAQIERFRGLHPQTELVGDAEKPEDERVLAVCAELAATADPQDPAFQPRPLYIRAPDVTLPAKNPNSAGGFGQSRST